jgi:hypothetical protein
MQTETMSPGLSLRAVDRLFARFAAMYGDAAMKRMWGQQQPDAVKGVWCDSLGRYSVEQILAGIRALEESGVTFPPSLPEFVALCKRKPAPVVAMHQPLALPAPRTDGELAAARAKVERLVATVGREQPRDPLSWAYRVIERYRGGDKVLAHASYKMACAALLETGREVPA